MVLFTAEVLTAEWSKIQDLAILYFSLRIKENPLKNLKMLSFQSFEGFKYAA